MSRYISKEWLEDNEPMWDSGADEQWFRTATDSAPSIEIVKCKDCIHGHTDAPTEICPMSCDISWGGVFENDFCSYGERKDDA